MKVSPVLAGPLSLTISKMSFFTMVGRDVINVEKTVENTVIPHTKLRKRRLHTHVVSSI